MNRYETLNVSLQTDNRNDSRLSQTIDYSREDESEEQGQSDDRVRRFRELYYRNQKLRRQLKLLNAKLNERLEKVKLPNVKKRALSVDLNHHPPNKALQRQLENAYKQVKMYKQQIQILRIKEESQQNYSRLRDIENAVLYKDRQIADIQQQLISAKNVKKLQQRKIISQLENQDIKERLQQYQAQKKQLKGKLKNIASKSRKRQTEYKKQQAYLVSLQKKTRDTYAQNKKQQAKQFKQVNQVRYQMQRPERQISEKQFRQIKEEIYIQKKHNDEILIKIESDKKIIQNLKHQNQQDNAKFKQRQAYLKSLQMKLLQVNRLLREQQRKQKQQKQQQGNKLITNLQDIGKTDEQEGEDSFSQNQNTPTISKQDTLNKMLIQMQGNQREWKGKYRKVQHGFGAPGDRKFQYQGNLIGFRISLDENQAICGLGCVFENENGKQEVDYEGNRSNIQLRWLVQDGERITKITGSFTEQSYLNELIVSSSDGNTGVFGASSTDVFIFKLNKDQRISGCFGSIRELGIDKRITQLGFWIQKKQK